MFIPFALAKQISTPIARNGSDHPDPIPRRPADAADLPEEEVGDQVDRAAAGSRSISEVNAAAIAAPARASLSGVAPPRPSEPTEYTRTDAIAAPATATTTYPYGSDNPKNTIPIATASEAPAETPRIPGSASGLRVTACIVAPDTDSAAPTSNASTVRGTRLMTAARPSASPRSVPNRRADDLVESDLPGAERDRRHDQQRQDGDDGEQPADPYADRTPQRCGVRSGDGAERSAHPVGWSPAARSAK